jgi:restriction system protein
MDPYDFEKCVADVWERHQGWHTKVMQQSNDRGLDVVGQPPGRVDDKTAVQCKRYTSQKVRSREIQQYHALRDQYTDVTQVTVVTTTDFTSAAADRARELGVKCIDGGTFAGIVRDANARDVVERYGGR